MIKYQKSITAFIDVLGFSNMVFDANEEQISLYFLYLKKNLKTLAQYKGLRSFYISDTIILVGDDTIDTLIKTLQLIQILQSELLALNIITRGAITIGDIYLNEVENIIVGPSLIHSYQLEQQAKFPRVIIDRAIIPYFQYTSTTEFINNVVSISKKEFAKLIDTDKDELLFIDYFSHFFSRFQNYKSKKSFDNLIKLIQKQYFSNQHLEKYSWIRDKCIQELISQIQMQDHLNPITKSAKTIRNQKIRILPMWLEKFKEL